MIREIFIVSYIHSHLGKSRTESRTVTVNHSGSAEDYSAMHDSICLQLKNKINPNYLNDDTEIDLSLIAVSSMFKEEIYG